MTWSTLVTFVRHENQQNTNELYVRTESVINNLSADQAIKSTAREETN